MCESPLPPLRVNLQPSTFLCTLLTPATLTPPRPAPVQQTHWTELPAQFVATLDKQAAAGTLIFRGLGFFDVGVAVFTGNYDLLHDHLVKYTPALAAAGRCDVEAMLRRRLAPIIMS